MAHLTYEVMKSEPLIHAAVEDNDVYTIKRLLTKGHNVNEYWDGETALHAAAKLGYAQVVQTLVHIGKADVNLLTKHRNESPLYLASAEGHIDVVKYLIENGASVHGNKGSGTEAMQAAARYGCTRILRYLIEQGMDVDSPIPNGQLPITLATQHGHLGTITELIASGCDVNKPDTRGHTALFIAVMYQHWKVVDALVQADAHVDSYNHEFQACPLHLASSNGDIETIKVLLAAKCDVNAIQDLGQTALYVAAELGYLEIVELLLAAGADPDIMTIDTDNTAIFAALDMPALSMYINAHKPIKKIVRLLICAGCNVDHENKAGQTPLQAALDKQLCDVAQLLLEADCSLHQECWFTCEMDFYIISLENNCPELYSTFMYELKNPRSLKRLCRSFIRECLTMEGYPYDQSVSQLPLPKFLQQFVLYKDLA